MTDTFFCATAAELDLLDAILPLQAAAAALLSKFVSLASLTPSRSTYPRRKKVPIQMVLRKGERWVCAQTAGMDGHSRRKEGRLNSAEAFPAQLVYLLFYSPLGFSLSLSLSFFPCSQSHFIL
jgi:hypothetical protein